MCTMWVGRCIHPVFNEKSEKKWNFFRITPCKCSWKFYNWRRSWETRPKAETNRTEARETSGKIEGIGDVLSDGPRKFLGSQLIKRRESRPSLLGHDRAEDLSDTFGIAIYEKQDRLFKNQWRVWSWLRTNAGGVSYTCKSSEAAMPSGERVSNA